LHFELVELSQLQPCYFGIVYVAVVDIIAVLGRHHHRTYHHLVDVGGCEGQAGLVALHAVQQNYRVHVALLRAVHEAEYA